MPVLDRVMTTHERVNDCCICLLAPLFTLWKTLCLMANFRCPHRNKNVIIPEITTTKYSKIPGYISVFLIFISILICLKWQIEDGFDLSKNFEMYLINATNLFTIYMSIIYCTRDEGILYYKRIIELVDKRHLYGLDEIFTKTTYQHFMFFVYFLWGTSMINLIIFISFIILQPTLETVLFLIGLSASYYNLAMLTSQSVATPALYKIILQSCLEQIEKTVNERHNTSTPLYMRIQYLQKYYMAIVQNYLRHIHCRVPTTLIILCLLVLTFFDVSSYSLITEFLANRISKSRFSFLLFYTFISHIPFCIITYQAEVTYNLVRNCSRYN